MKAFQRTWALCFAMSTLPLAAAGFHEGYSVLSKEEQALVLGTHPKGKGFATIWRNPEIKGFGLLRWDAEHSHAVPEAFPGLLSTIRDGLGILNQKARPGDPLMVTVNVYKFRRQTFITNPKIFFEIVGRTLDGKLAWIAIDSAKSSMTEADGLGDTDSAMMSRVIVRKMREEFGL